MNEHQKATARTCLEAAEGNTVSFPQIVGALTDAGFESYAIDFRRATATFYLPDGESIELPAKRVTAPIAQAFDTTRMQAAIRGFNVCQHRQGNLQGRVGLIAQGFLLTVPCLRQQFGMGAVDEVCEQQGSE